MSNHQQQQQEDQQTMVSMAAQIKNLNLETTHNHHVPPSPSSSSLEIKCTTHHQHTIHTSKITHEEKGFNFKNAHQVIKKPNISPAFSSSTLEAGTTPLQDFKKINHQHNIHVSKNLNGNEGFNIDNINDCEVIKESNSLSCSSPAVAREEEESGRDRLKRHRVEVAGRVRIPDIWGHEDLLKDWIDCTVFDSSLGNNAIMSARSSLVQERRSSTSLRIIQN